MSKINWKGLSPLMLVESDTKLKPLLLTGPAPVYLLILLNVKNTTNVLLTVESKRFPFQSRDFCWRTDDVGGKKTHKGKKAEFCQSHLPNPQELHGQHFDLKLVRWHKRFKTSNCLPVCSLRLPKGEMLTLLKKMTDKYTHNSHSTCYTLI